MPQLSVHSSPMHGDRLSSNPSQVIFTSDLLRVATYRRHGERADFEAQDRILSGHLVVFPRTSVQINYEEGGSIIANPNLVTLYNLNQGYSRKKISERGDFCEWFDFDSELLLGMIHKYDPTVDARPNKPFRARVTTSEPSCYLRQRIVVEHILQEEKPDRIFVEETMVGVLDDVLRGAFQAAPGSDSPVRDHTLRQHRDIAQAAQEILSTSYDQELTLNELAAQLYVSPYLLCRIFRQQTGATIHNYLNQLRLRTALEAVRESCGRLTDLALNLGYSSHSHFTQAFRTAFGITPSDLQSIYEASSATKVDIAMIHGAMPLMARNNHTQLLK